jgi:hypothetical protein
MRQFKGHPEHTRNVRLHMPARPFQGSLIYRHDHVTTGDSGVGDPILGANATVMGHRIGELYHRG